MLLIELIKHSDATIVWHVTTANRLSSIVKSGLLRSAEKNFDDHELAADYYRGERANAIFVSDSFDEANTKYRMVVGGAKPNNAIVILKVEIPADKIHLLKDDDYDRRNNKAKHAKYFVGDIPPSWIVAAKASFGDLDLSLYK